MSAMNAALDSLQQPAQTFAERRKLHQEYQSAIRQLREDLVLSPDAASSYCSTYMFALYEMLVNLDSEDRTWQIHLDGFLTLLRQRPSSCGTGQVAILMEALTRSDNSDTTEITLSNNLQDDLDKASLIIDIAKLRLKAVAHNLHHLVTATPYPRKLDIQKTRVSLKRVQRDISTVPSLLLATLRPDSIALQNEYRTIVVVLAYLLLQCGAKLQPTSSYEETREFQNLARVAREAVDGICASVACALAYPRERAFQRFDFRDCFTALSMIWPLTAALKGTGIDGERQEWIRGALWRIGEEGCVPKALSLSITPSEEIGFVDVLAGLTVTGVASPR
ncbi:hypothetical protein EJ04DRAFT_562785 [Polyplosphaeria fusca]|uniref:Uncharacterized protein n=1 Tax=Polyplosphaeria fusca TaxID=682080 RepID=A0A9P4R2W2_9PLEO|nr:hypothetical protein EJ04DRAFT_562785 [Polyplosphaeria fusca]